MATWEVRSERSEYRRPEEGTSKVVCRYWADGRCNKKYCKFFHPDASPSTMDSPHIAKPRSLVWTREGSATGKGNQCSSTPKTNAAGQKRNGTQKFAKRVCKFWVDGNCAKGDQCGYLHKWFLGEEISMLTKLEGHKKAVLGIALPQGSNKLFSASKDGTARVWDCQTGLCGSVVDVGGEARCLISEGPWIFVGVTNVVKVWNTQTNDEFNLDGPVGQVHSVVVGSEMLFARSQDGVIYVWKACSEANPFRPAATLKGHTGAVACLTVRGNRLYSGSVDHTFRVWDLNTLQCVMTLNEHSGAVMSLICWNDFLISCSLDCTTKVWVASATEGGNLEVTYTHSEEHGVLALSGMTVEADSKHILLSSCNDNSVRLYELPSFTERGRIYAKEGVRTISIGPGGLFFTGDATGLLSVWKWIETASKVESS